MGVVWIVPSDDPASARVLLTTEFEEWSPTFSPDGRFLTAIRAAPYSAAHEVAVVIGWSPDR